MDFGTGENLLRAVASEGQLFEFLDDDSAKQLRLTCRTAAELYAWNENLPRLHHIQHLQHQVQVTTTPPSASASNHHAHFEDSGSDTEIEMHTPPSEVEEWQFQITPEISRCLSLIPSRATGPSLASLPAELQLEVFTYLDKIDSCCLGLASPNLYVVYRAIHGTKMPLDTRRIGPNALESAWEVVGKRWECKQCGVYRCELHEHIKSWIPKTLEYCAMKKNFGLIARPGSKPTCFRVKPSKPRRCGRHPQRTTTIHQDDVKFALEGLV